MDIQGALSGVATSVILGRPVQNMMQKRRQWLAGADGNKILFFYQLSDPYSHLLAQVL